MLKNLGKKRTCCEENNFKKATEEAECGSGDDEKFGTDSMKVLVYPKPTAIFKSLLPLQAPRLRPSFC
jgi:hypothetical protein